MSGQLLAAFAAGDALARALADPSFEGFVGDSYRYGAEGDVATGEWVARGFARPAVRAPAAPDGFVWTRDEGGHPRLARVGEGLACVHVVVDVRREYVGREFTGQGWENRYRHHYPEGPVRVLGLDAARAVLAEVSR